MTDATFTEQLRSGKIIIPLIKEGQKVK